MATWRAEIEVRTVLVGWRDVMADIRAGYLPQSRESIHRVTEWALHALSGIERRHTPAGALGPSEQLAALISEARSEVQGSSFHDLADSGEQTG